MKKDYYLFTSGELKRKDNTLLFVGLDNVKKYIPIVDVEDIHIFSHISFNTDFLNFISNFNINIHIYDYYGNYTNTITPKENQISGFVKINQAKCYLNTDDRLYLCREILASAFNTMRKNLQEYNTDIDIESFNNKLNDCGMSNIMLIEAEFRRNYYKFWDTNILKNLKFEKRTRMPPENEVNALISFGNSMCYSLCLKYIRQTYIDSSISFLHEPSDRRHSLCLDLAEIFKPLFVDRVIFNIINKNIVNNNDFIYIGKLCHLNESGKKKFIKAYEDKLKTKIFNQKMNKNISYESLVKYECYKLIKHFTNDQKYKSLNVYW